MDFLNKLLDFEGKKSFKKDIHSEEVNVEVYLERAIKWLGLFSLALAVIAQLMNEVSGTDMKCFPDKKAGFKNENNWMADQMALSKAFGEYVDVHCATAMIDFGPLVPNDTALSASQYTRNDLTTALNLPYRRCLESKGDVTYCICEAKWEDGGKIGTNKCPPPNPAKPDLQKVANGQIKYREMMFHHYFPWFLMMQAVFILLPQHIWTGLFSEKILRKFLKIHDCTQSPPEDLEQQGKELVDSLESLRTPVMTIIFAVKQVYYLLGGIIMWHYLYKYVGYGIQENQITRCLMEEYTFVICASPANGTIWFVYVIDVGVILLIVGCAIFNIIALVVKRVTKAHLKKEFLKKLLDKMFENKFESLESACCSDYPLFSRLVQENKHIFGDTFISLTSRDEIDQADDDMEEEEYVDAWRKTMLLMRQSKAEGPSNYVTQREM